MSGGRGHGGGSRRGPGGGGRGGRPDRFDRGAAGGGRPDPGAGRREFRDRDRDRGRRSAGGDERPSGDRLVYGRNPVRELIRAGRRHVRIVHALPQLADAPWLSEQTVQVVSADDLEVLAGTHDHQGIVAECAPYPYVELASLIGRPGTVIVLDEITDPRNVGAIARTAEATGAIGLVVPERRAAQVNATVCKTSAGAIEHLHVAVVRNVADAVQELKAGGAWTYGAAMDGAAFGDLDLTGSVALVLGGEGKGLRPRVAGACDALVSLPMVGKVDSLNVSAAAAVLMYAAFTAQHR
ncbi:MAG: 23S rRNA (guanosine(2251)-2'-O)-methyltransferase RlmB [Patulibacter minatonensis]